MSDAWPIAVSSSALSENLREAARGSRAMGFDGLNVELAGRQVELLELSETGQREVRQILNGQNQVLVGLTHRLPAKSLRPEADVDRVLAQVERAIKAARGLRAQVLCVDLGLLPPPPPTAEPPRAKIDSAQAGLILIPEMNAAPPEPTRAQAPVDPAFTASAETVLRELCQRADRHGVMVALRSELSGFRALEALLVALDCPWFGVDLDPVAVLEDDWSLDEVFDHLGTQIRHVRARDAVRGTDRRTQPAAVGRGDTPWEALLANLDGAGYRGAVTVDPGALADRAGAARAGLAHLRRKD
jgi:sugar phosphate isomerase/epimerase